MALHRIANSSITCVKILRLRKPHWCPDQCFLDAFFHLSKILLNNTTEILLWIILLSNNIILWGIIVGKNDHYFFIRILERKFFISQMKILLFLLAVLWPSSKNLHFFPWNWWLSMFSMLLILLITSRLEFTKESQVIN